MRHAPLQVIAPALLVIASGAFASAEPTFTYLSQDRYVEAEASFGVDPYGPFCDGPEDPSCAPSVDHQMVTSGDFEPFRANILARRSGGEGGGARARITQESDFAPDRIQVLASLEAGNSSYEPGTWDYDMSSFGRSVFSVVVEVDSPSVVRLVASATSDYYHIGDGYGAEFAFARLKHHDGPVIYDSTAERVDSQPLEYQIDRSFELPAGVYDFDVKLFAYSMPDSAYGGSGRIEIAADLILESAAVPEPSSLSLLSLAAIGMAWRKLQRTRRKTHPAAR